MRGGQNTDQKCQQSTDKKVELNKMSNLKSQNSISRAGGITNEIKVICF